MRPKKLMRLSPWSSEHHAEFTFYRMLRSWFRPADAVDSKILKAQKSYLPLPCDLCLKCVSLGQINWTLWSLCVSGGFQTRVLKIRASGWGGDSNPMHQTVDSEVCSSKVWRSDPVQEQAGSKGGLQSWSSENLAYLPHGTMAWGLDYFLNYFLLDLDFPAFLKCLTLLSLTAKVLLLLGLLRPKGV